jgi:L-alanine-DL-glutamate epimerase-like enolase superfamily enzyme
MSLYPRLAELPITIETHALEPRSFETPGFTRLTTTVVLQGAGHEGHGEDIAYDDSDQDAHRAMTPLPLAGTLPLGEWSALLDTLELFPTPASSHAVHDYRRWAYESALLDLALSQAGVTLGTVLGRTPQPVRFCVSSSLGPKAWLAEYPEMEFKLDASEDWDDAYVADLEALDRVRVVDLKAHYGDSWPVPRADPTGMTRRIATLMPDVIIEDPPTDETTWAVIADETQRVAFDAPVHSLADMLALPQTGCMNIKPSRFGTLERLLAAIEHCEVRGIQMYGGGQFELGVGRPQIQELAALFYPDGPNDVAPGAYNATSVTAGLPTSPLTGLGHVPGFGRLA